MRYLPYFLIDSLKLSKSVMPMQMSTSFMDSRWQIYLIFWSIRWNLSKSVMPMQMSTSCWAFSIVFACRSCLRPAHTEHETIYWGPEELFEIRIPGFPIFRMLVYLFCYFLCYFSFVLNSVIDLDWFILGPDPDPRNKEKMLWKKKLWMYGM